MYAVCLFRFVSYLIFQRNVNWILTLFIVFFFFNVCVNEGGCGCCTCQQCLAVYNTAHVLYSKSKSIVGIMFPGAWRLLFFFFFGYNHKAYIAGEGLN